MKKSITWLHISDIHFNVVNEWLHGNSRAELLEHLKTIFQNNSSLKPDFIFCTGDIAYGETSSTTMQDQYSRAETFLEELRVACGDKDNPLPKERIFLVPGNHDVNRVKINSDAQATLTNWANNAADHIEKINQRFNDRNNEFNENIKRLENYAAFINSYLPHQADSNGRHFYALVQEIEGLKIGIAGFNSAWTCSGPEDDRNLWLAAKWQFNAATTALKDADIRIGLIHHPIDWFNSEDRKVAESHIPSQFDFWLHGHNHNAWVVPGQHHIVISAGAVGAHTNEEFGVNLTRIALLESKGETNLYSKKVGRPGWTVTPINTHAPEGKWSYKLPARLEQRRQQLVKPNNSTKNVTPLSNNDPISIFLNKKFEDSLKAFSSVPKVWIPPIVSTAPEIALEAKSAKQIDLQKFIEDPNSAFIKAPPQYGLTCLARFLVKEAWASKNREFWLYLDARELKPHSASIDQAKANELESIGFPEQDIKAVVLDSWCSADRDALKLLKKVSDKFADIPIICMQQVNGNEFSSPDVSSSIRKFDSMYLWSLERTDIRRIVTAYSEANPLGDEDAVTTRLVNDLEVLNLHRTPLNCLTLLKVSEIDFEDNPVNRCDIIKRVLFLLFNLDEIPSYKTRPDLKDCEYVLGYFCQLLIEDGVYSFTRDKFILDASRFCKENLLDLEVHLVFDILYENNILIKIGNSFYFKFSYWIFYFAAQRMHHDKKFADFIFSDMRYAQHPELVEFYTGVDRKREDAIQILIRDIQSCRNKVNSNVGFPDRLNPYKFGQWIASPKTQEQMTRVISDGVKESNLPTSIKDQFADRDYDKCRPYNQTINTLLSEHQFLNMMRIMRAGARALRNSDYVNPALKRQLLSEILACWDQASKVLFIVLPMLAKDKYASFDGAGFILTDEFSDSPEQRVVEILNEIPRNVASWNQDDLYSRKMGPLLIDQLSQKDLSDISKHELIILLIQQRPRNWEKAIHQYIGSCAKNSFYLFDVYRTLRIQYKYGFISPSSLKEVEHLIKMCATKHITGEKEPGIKAISKIKFDENTIPKREV